MSPKRKPLTVETVMKTDSLTVKDHESKILELAQSKGKTPQEMLNAILEAGIKSLTSERAPMKSRIVDQIELALTLIEKHNGSCESILDKMFANPSIIAKALKTNLNSVKKAIDESEEIQEKIAVINKDLYSDVNRINSKAQTLADEFHKVCVAEYPEFIRTRNKQTT